MRIGRTLSPAAAPLRWTDLWHGLAGMVAPARALRETRDGDPPALRCERRLSGVVGEGGADAHVQGAEVDVEPDGGRDSRVHVLLGPRRGGAGGASPAALRHRSADVRLRSRSPRADDQREHALRGCASPVRDPIRRRADANPVPGARDRGRGCRPGDGDRTRWPQAWNGRGCRDLQSRSRQDHYLRIGRHHRDRARHRLPGRSPSSTGGCVRPRSPKC